MKSCVIFSIVTLILTLSCCREHVTGPSGDFRKIPSVLTDNVPYAHIVIGKIVFQRSGPVHNSYSGVVIIDAERKSASTIRESGNGVAVSPDGSTITWTDYDSAIKNTYTWDTFVMSIDGTNKKNISTINGQDQYPSWAADSRSVYFYLMALPYSGHQYLYCVGVDQPGTKKIVYDFYNLFPLTHFHESSSGSLVFVATGPDGASLYTLDAKNPAAPVKVLLSLKTMNGWCFTPCWSPDGNKIAFVTMKTRAVKDSTKPNAGATIYPAGGRLIVYDIVSSTINTIYEWDVPDCLGGWSGFNELSACWSPDGGKLAFNKIKSGLESHIYIINADGTGLVQVTDEPGVCDRSVSWSRN